MLVLSRKIGEQIIIGDGVTVTVLEIQGQRIKLGIEAPRDCRVLRGELNQWAGEGTSDAIATTRQNAKPQGSSAGRKIAWMPAAALANQSAALVEASAR